MKTLIIASILIFTLIACGDSKKDYDKFMNTYSEVLLTRELILDSVVANAKVKEIMIKNGYTLNSFKEEMFKLAKDRESFKSGIDSLRTKITEKIDFYNNQIKKDTIK
jgi:hypothetical protein